MSTRLYAGLQKFGHIGFGQKVGCCNNRRENVKRFYLLGPRNSSVYFLSFDTYFLDIDWTHD